MDIISISPIELTVAVSAALGAGLLRGAAGFGSALILAPVLAQVFDTQDAVATSLMVGLTASAIMAPRHLRDLSPPVVATVGLAGIACLVPGIMLLHLVEPDIMRRVIGWITLVMATIMLIARHGRFPSGPISQTACGAVAGLLMGSTSMGGPPVALYLIGRPDRQDATKANIIYVVGILEAGSLMMLAATGIVSLRAVAIFALLLPAFAVGTLFGRRLYGHVGDSYRLLILLVLLCIGLTAAIR